MNRDAFVRELTPDGRLRADSVLPQAFFREGGSVRYYLVFSQRKASVPDLASWRARARTFFSADLGLGVDRSPAESASPDVDAALVMVHSGDVSGTRVVFTRPSEPADHALARQLEVASNAHGMSLLADRCPRVWLVAAEAANDRAALLLAAIVASSELGPIVDPDATQIFGVRTARQQYEAMQRAYR